MFSGWPAGPLLFSGFDIHGLYSGRGGIGSNRLQHADELCEMVEEAVAFSAAAKDVVPTAAPERVASAARDRVVSALPEDFEAVAPGGDRVVAFATDDVTAPAADGDRVMDAVVAMHDQRFIVQDHARQKPPRFERLDAGWLAGHERSFRFFEFA